MCFSSYLLAKYGRGKEKRGIFFFFPFFHLCEQPVYVWKKLRAVLFVFLLLFVTLFLSNTFISSWDKSFDG